MLNKKVVKDIQSLNLKKHRSETGLFVAEGPKVVRELLQLIPEQFQTLYATDTWQKEQKDWTPVPVETITEDELQKISQLQTANQVLAVLKQLTVEKPVVENEWALYLDTIQDPGNFGTIIRIADWFGIKHIICSKGCTDLYNPKVVQSTMASIARVKVWYDEEESWLTQQWLPVLAATLGGQSIYEHEKISAGILLIGNESKGIRPEYIQQATHRITIPRIGEAESLNAAVATGIILSHLVKG
jgi:RNA methyltransferase, TrmH family